MGAWEHTQGIRYGAGGLYTLSLYTTYTRILYMLDTQLGSKYYTFKRVFFLDSGGHGYATHQRDRCTNLYHVPIDIYAYTYVCQTTYPSAGFPGSSLRVHRPSSEPSEYPIWPMLEIVLAGDDVAAERVAVACQAGAAEPCIFDGAGG